MAVTSLYSGIGSLGGKVGSINTPKTLQNIETTSKRFIAKSMYEGVPSIYDTRQIDPLEKNPIVLAKLDDSKQINSVLDIIFNEAALQKNYKSAGLKARFMATRDMLQQQYINPMLQGQWGVVGLNTLTNLGESLDVFGNVIKSLTVPLFNNSADQVDYEYAEAALSAVATDNVHTNTAPDGTKTYQALIDGNLTSFTSKDLEFYERIVNSGRTVNYAKLSTSERLKASIGIGEHGRINFEYATGNMFADTVMEIISDPDTWLTFGTSSLGKSAASNVVDSAGDIARQLDNVLMDGVTDEAQRLIISRQIKQFTESLTEQGLVQEATEKYLAKLTGMAKNSDQKAWIEAFLGPVIKAGKVEDNFAVKTLADAITVTMQSKGLLSGMDAVTARQMSDILNRSIDTAMNRVTLKALRTVDTLNKGADAVNKALAIAALSPSGVYPVYRIIKEASPAVGRWITQQLTNASAINSNEFGDMSINAFFDAQPNIQRANQRIKDMLFNDEDLRRLYKEPEHISFFYNRMGQDQVILSEIVEKFADAPLEAAEALNNYMALAHKGASFGRLIDAAKKAQRYLTAGGSKGDPVLAEYIQYLSHIQKNYIPSAEQLDVITKIARIERTMDLHDTTSTKMQETFVTKWQQHYESMIDDLGTFAIDEDIENINYFLARRDQFIGEVQKEFSEYIDTLGVTIRENLTSLYKISDDVTVTVHNAIGEVFEGLEELHTVYSVRLAQLYEIHDVDAIVRALKEGAPNPYELLEVPLAKVDAAVKRYEELFYKPLKASKGAHTSLQKLSSKVSKAGNTYEEIKQVLDSVRKYQKGAEEITLSTPFDVVPKLKGNVAYYQAAQELLHAEADLIPLAIISDLDLAGLGNNVPDEISNWLRTAIDDAAYSETWWLAQDALKKAKVELAEQSMTEATMTIEEIKTRSGMLGQLDFILHEVLKPDERGAGGQLLDPNETWLTLKFEQTKAYLDLVNDPDITKAMATIKSDPALREALKGTDVLNTADQFYINKSLLQTIMQSPMEDRAKQGGLAAIQRLHRVKPDKMAADMDRYVDEVVKNTQDYIVNTKQAKQLLSLDYIKATRGSDYAAFRELIGLGEAGAAHTADEDVIMSLFVFYDLAERGDETAKQLIENKVRLISFDLETQNAQGYMNNTIHQGAIAVLEDGTVTNQYSSGLTRGAIADGLMPSPGYIENKLGKTAEGYLTTMSGAIDNERDLVLDQLQQLYNAMSDTFDFEAKRYHAALVTQNGVAFDIECLKGKIKQYELVEEMVARRIDPDFLDRCIIYDTLLQNQKMLGRFSIEGADKETLRTILQNYVDDMLSVKAEKLFSAPSIDSLTEAAEALRLKGYDDVAKQLSDSLEAYGALGMANKALRKDPVARSLMLNTVDAAGVESMPQEVKELWLRYYRSQMSEEAFARAFGEGTNLTPSVLLGANNEFQSLAYSYRYNKDLVDNWFINDKAESWLTPLEAAKRQGISKVLQRSADKVKFPDLYVPYHAEIKEAIEKFRAMPEYAYMRSVRVDTNSIQQDFAILRFMAQRLDPKVADINAIVSPELKSFIRAPMDWMDLRGINKYAKSFDEGRIMNKATQYLEQTNALLNLRSDIPQFEQFLDREEMWDAATQLRLRTVQDTADMMSAASRLASPEIVGRDNARAFRNRVTAATRELKLGNMYDFLKSDADRTVHWLSESGGFVLVKTETAEELAQALQKYQTTEFAGRNIKATVFGEHGWVWLDSNAKHAAYMDPETGKFVFSVNGTTLPRMEWKPFKPELDLLPEELKNSLDGEVFNEMFKSAQKQLDFISEGASGNSVFDGFYVNDPNNDILGQLYEAMPPEMRASFPDEDYLRRSEFWQGSHFNHTVLGVDVTAVDTYSTDIVSSLGAAMERSVKNLSTAQVYTAALLDQTGGIAQTAIAQAYRESPAEVYEYLRKHPEVVLVVPEASDKSKFGVRVAEVVIKHPQDLQYALDNNARIMTSTVYNKLYEVLNDNIYSDTAVEAWQSIMRMYKVGYLTTPGTWARNGYDAFIKNMMSADVGPTTMSKAYANALTDLHNYNEVLEILYKRGEGVLPAADEIQAFFAGYSKMTYERFDYINKFSMTSAAGGEAAIFSKMHRTQQEEYMEKLLLNGAVTSDIAASFEQRRAFQHMTNTMLYPMGLVERVSRLAEYDVLTQKGFNKSKAVDLVEKTHFSYDTKSPIEQTMELIIPFYTFMSRNFEFWADMVERKPTYLALMRDVLEPAWDMEQYDPEELVENPGLNYQVMSGNVPLGDTGYYLNASFSFMDSLTLLTDTANSFKSSVFSPVQVVLDVALQEMSNGAYLNGQDSLSIWMQNTFGMKPTEQQIRDKYGDWADTYLELHGHKVAGRTPKTELQMQLSFLTFVPLVGATISRFLKTGVYYDDENFLGGMAYLFSLAGKPSRWPDSPVLGRELARQKINGLLQDSSQAKEVWAGILQQFGVDPNTSLYSLDGQLLDQLWATFRDSYQRINSQLYDLLQKGDAQVWMYTRLKAAMGYSGVTMKDLPAEVREAILAIMQGEAPTINVLPVLQDQEAMQTMWHMVATKFDAPDNFDEIPQDMLNQMYFEIARGATYLTRIMSMLSEDESTRYSYAVAKNKLGLDGLKLSQLPADALELIEHAMVTKYYGVGRAGSSSKALGQKPRAGGTTSCRRVYHNKTYVAAAGTGLYSTKKAVYANYGHRKAQHQFGDIVKKHYTKTGTRRMQLRMLGITPENMKHRVKDLFYYYK